MCGDSQRSLGTTAAERKIKLSNTIRDGEPDMALTETGSKGQPRSRQLYWRNPEAKWSKVTG